jgi:hypothetical protein
MANNLLRKLEKDGESNTRLFVIGGILLFGIAIGLYINNIYLNPTNVFWTSFKNNITTNGFTKENTTTNSGETLRQVIQIGLVGKNYAHSFSYLTHSGTTVVTEEINSPTYEYVRYVNIKANPKNSGGKTKDYKKVLNIWGYSPIKSISQQSTETFYQTIFGLMPFGNLSPDQSDSLLSYAKTNKVYTVVKSKSATVNGQKVDSLTVAISLEGYVKMMQKFGGYINYNALNGISAQAYAGRKPVQVSISINPISRNLVQINNGQVNGINNYSGFGIDPSLTLPKNTISLTNLQAKIQSIK